MDPEPLDEIDRLFVQNYNRGEGNFSEKLEIQLATGTPECRQPMAELL